MHADHPLRWPTFARRSTLYGQGTPREAAETLYALIIVLRTEAALVFVLIATVDGELAVIVIVAADPTQN